jgi:tryptophanyl-tRNA synthetase
MADLYRRGGFGYGEVKKALVEAAAAFFADARARRAELEADPARIEAILAAGAAKARAKAGEVLGRARRACGLARGETVVSGGKGGHA